MKAGTEIAPPNRPPPWKHLMQSRLCANRAARMEAQDASGVLLSVPVLKRWWARPPLTWIFPLRPHRRFAMDPVGAALWRACRKKVQVKTVVTEFAAHHGLSFHEARVALSPYLRQLIERGILVLVGENASDNDPT